MALRSGDLGLTDAVKLALDLESQLDDWYSVSRIRLVPDYERINRFILRVRQEVWQ